MNKVQYEQNAAAYFDLITDEHCQDNRDGKHGTNKLERGEKLDCKEDEENAGRELHVRDGGLFVRACAIK